MKKHEFLLLLDELVYEDPGTLDGSEALVDLEGWDSLAAVSFIALVDEHFDSVVSPKTLSACKTVDDLVGLLNGRIS